MNELLTRAVTNVTPKDLAEKKLKSGKPIRVYLGIDPTGAHLHLGHSVPLRKLQAFADAGHEVIFLIGSFTAMIGDPSGRDSMREPLTKSDVEKNFQDYKKQAEKVLDFSKVKIMYNHEWLEKLNFEDIVKLASNFTVKQMLERDMFRLRNSVKIECPHCHQKTIYKHNPLASINEKDNARLANWDFYVDQILTNEENYFKRDKQNPRGQKCDECGEIIQYFKLKSSDFSPADAIGIHEFLYPLMVGYDSVVMDVDCELGGNDQYFNMLAGRTLQTALGKKDKFVLTTKLIEGTDGRKMSKTYNNCIYLDDEANDMFGKVMRIKDDLMETYFECCTDVPMDEVKKILKGNPREAKVRLAKEIVTLYHSAKDADKAEAEFNKVFAEGGLPEDIPEFKARKGMTLIDALTESKIVKSKSEARRLIEQGGVKHEDTVINFVEVVVDEGVYRVGKRKFLRVTL